MEKFESVQYSASLTITRAWKGTSREKIYAEFGWESLSCRSWSRRITLFYKILNNLTPQYTKDPIPTPYQSKHALRNHDTVGRIGARTEEFQARFYLILIAYLSEIRLTQRLETHRQLLRLNISFCKKFVLQ